MENASNILIVQKVTAILCRWKTHSLNAVDGRVCGLTELTHSRLALGLVMSSLVAWVIL